MVPCFVTMKIENKILWTPQKNKNRKGSKKGTELLGEYRTQVLWVENVYKDVESKGIKEEGI